MVSVCLESMVSMCLEESVLCLPNLDLLPFLQTHPLIVFIIIENVVSDYLDLRLAMFTLCLIAVYPM